MSFKSVIPTRLLIPDKGQSPVNTADWTPDTRQNVYVQTETAEKGTDKTYE